jgi:choline dehydrogenase-like flavoprotein
LLEAGGPNDQLEDRIMADRWTTFFTRPHFNWNYHTTPQKDLKNREIAYHRGRGLGGSSSINFAFWTVGSNEDFNEWAKQVGDESFNWKNAQRRFKNIEGYGSVQNPKHLKYIDPKSEDHGHEGPVKVECPPEWERTFDTVLDASYDYGMAANLDLNSGNEIGLGVCLPTAHESYRSTAATAYLTNKTSNLTIVTDSPVTKILFDGKTAVGVVAGGKQYYAEKEVILTAGALDTPKVLLLSGIGPKEELSRHDIPTVVNLPVGQGLQDHAHVNISMQLKDGSNDRAAWSSSEAMQASREQFSKDGTGSFKIFNSLVALGFFNGSKELFASDEFAKLPAETQRYIKHPSIPSWEIGTNCPPLTPMADPTHSYLTVVAFAMVPQSRGTVTLKSADPNDPPVSDPRLMSHAFDRVNMIGTVRQAYNYITSPSMSKDTIKPFMAPKSASEEDIWAFIQENCNSTWHMSSTARMGKIDDEEAVVTSDFKVKGLKGLRVADMSITPFLPNCHTMAIAYFIGESASEKIIADYGLDE